MNVGNTVAVQPLPPAAVIAAVFAHLPVQENETIRYSSVFILSPFLQNPILGFFPFLYCLHRVLSLDMKFVHL